MGRWIDLDTPNGAVDAWRADPSGPSHRAVLVIQEIFGVNQHIQSVAARFAEAGFVALAPALFDAAERGVALDYDAAGTERGRKLVASLGADRALDTLAAARDELHDEGLRVGAVGFCWGGSLALLCNTRLGLPAVSYYGARSKPWLDEPARAAMMFHFGEDDPGIPAADIELHRRRQPQSTIHVYPGAGHAFNRDVDPDTFKPASSRLAWRRSVAFLEGNLG